MIKSARGDTIIEVLISIAIIGLALGAGYTLSNRSFHTGVGAVERSEALALAQGQVEFLKDAQLSGNMGTVQVFASDPANQQTLCFNTTTGTKVSTATLPSNTYTNTCKGIDGRYDVNITYNTPLPNVFNILVAWTAFGGNGQDQLTLYYKVP